MKKRTLIAAVLAFTFSTSSLAQAAQQTAPTQQAAPATPAPANDTAIPADPALWVVRDADTTVYLFGTVHALQPGLTWFDSAVKDAFDRSQTLVLELPAGAAEQVPALIPSRSAAPDATPLTQRLNDQQRSVYTEAMGKFNLPVAGFESRAPWFPGMLLSMMPMLQAGYDPSHGVEAALTRAAGEQGKQIVGLETPESQLDLFAALPMNIQVEFLVSSAEQSLKGVEPMQRMVDLWRTGKADELGDYINEAFTDYPDMRAPLLTNRNRNWAEWISTKLNETGGVYFIAVGAGHLAGSDSVQAILRERGINSERIAY